MHGGKLWARHPYVRTGPELKFRERAADALKMAFGTWTLLGLIIAGIIAWLLWVMDPGELHLYLGLSFLASVQGVILQIAANRGDRISAEVATGTYGNSQKLLDLQQKILEMQETQMKILAALGGVGTSAPVAATAASEGEGNVDRG